MKSVAALLKKVEAVSVKDISKTSIDETKEDIADLNRERMNEGKRADGSEMPFYSIISQTVYGYPNAPIKLKATGDFQRAINVNVTDKLIITDSSDLKSEMLKQRYGEDIFGLDTEGKKEYVKKLKPVFIGKIKKALK